MATDTDPPTHVVIFITTDKSEEAHTIAEALISNRKAACVNIVPGVSSYFWWEGKRESTQEYLLIAKTRASLLSQVIELIKKTHSYDVPEIIALPIIGGNRDYLEWIDKETK